MHDGVSRAPAPGVYGIYRAAGHLLRQAGFAFREISRSSISDLAALLHGGYFRWDGDLLRIRVRNRLSWHFIRAHSERAAAGLFFVLSLDLAADDVRVVSEPHSRNHVWDQG